MSTRSNGRRHGGAAATTMSDELALDGSAYVALVRLTTKSGETLADVGTRCTRVPASSLAWLAAQGLIRKDA